MLVDMIWVMKNLNNFEEKRGQNDYNYLCIDRSKKRDQERYCICNESKNGYTECTPQTKPFWLT